MDSKRAHILLALILFVLPHFHCGELQGDDIKLSGRVVIEDDFENVAPASPIFVVVSTEIDPRVIENDPLNCIVDLVEVGPYPHDFSIDLSNKGISPGQQVYIIAFISNGYTSGIPNLRAGDVMGFYIDTDTLDMAYTLQKGDNNYAEIIINRPVYDYKASIEGTLTSPEEGKVIFVAYAGDIDSFNFDDFDINAVVGYDKTTAPKGSSHYSFDIMPYGYNVPINNVYVFAFLDKNGNGHPDGGDMWGTASDDEGYPVTVTIDADSVTKLDITIDHEISESSGKTIHVTGNVIPPSGYGVDSPPIFMIVCKSDSPKAVFDDTIDTVKFFERLEPGKTDFDLDLSDAGLSPGDEVMIIALWDRDWVAGFPRLTEGDMIGYYISQDKSSYQYTLKEGYNTGITIDLHKTYEENNAVVEGTILGNEAGKVVVVAYNGVLESYDLNLDMDKIIGYEEFTKTAAPTDYSMEMMPFIETFPVDDVYIFAYLDNNDNGKPDEGDVWGSYNDSEGYPKTISIIDGVTSGIDISLDNVVQPPSGYTISIQGSFTAPAEYISGSTPAFIIVCQADAPDLIFEDTMKSVRYFEKLPTGQTTFNIDLSDTGLKPDDEVIIIAMWDKDWVAGFPRLTEGDMVGYYENDETYSYQYVLADGVNSGITIDLAKTYIKNDARIEGTILGTDAGQVITVAYTGALESYDINLEMDKIVGYEEFSKPAEPSAFSMDLLPFTQFPLNDLYLFAFLDNNDNGEPDAGDKWGSYNDADGYPQTVDLITSSDVISGVNITLDHDIPPATGYNISLQGSFTAPAAYATSTEPVFMIVCQADDPQQIFDNTLDTVKYFKKLPAGQTTFNIDLSGTDLIPDDKIMIIAMWDRDWVSGFPKLTAGDMIGYYINEDDYTYQYTLVNGVNSGITMNLCHTYAENSATVQGSVLGSESGDVIIIAYTGEFNSLDTTLDTDKIIGYQTITKGASAQAYTMDLMPFVTSFPVTNAFIFAILDTNGNGIPDDGDRLGFYSNNDKGIPSLVTLTNGANTGLDIEFTMNYIAPTTGGTPMTITGSFTKPSGYTTTSGGPIFIIIATAENTFDLFDNPLAAMKYFVKLPQGSNTYSIDLSGTGLVPGDEIRILALWDRDYIAGFPDPTAYDKIGYYQNKTTFAFSKVLAAGTNTANLSGGWSFGVDKTLYDHTGKLSFKFNQSAGNNHLSASLIQGQEVLVVTIQQGGVDDEWDFWLSAPSYGITDMDYITSIDYLSIPNNSSWQNNTYTVSFFPFIYDSISLNTNPLRMNNVYVYAILDSNRNGWPDTGEYVGFYWTWYWGNMIPQLFSPMYYDRTNTLPSGEVVTITTRTY